MEWLGYKYVTTDSPIDEAVAAIDGRKLMAVDLETTGLDPKKDKIRLVQLAVTGQPVWVIDWVRISKASRIKLKRLLESKIMKALQNAKFDIKFLQLAGIEMHRNVIDTMLAAQLLEAGLPTKSYGLGNLAERYLGVYLPKELQKSNWRSELSSEQLEYAARDAAVLIPLAITLYKKLKEASLMSTAKLECKVLPAVVEMELTGMPLDQMQLGMVDRRLSDRYQQVQKEINKWFPQQINLNSPKQVMEALQKMGIATNGTSYEALNPFASKYPAVAALLEHKKIVKLSQFTKKLSEHVDNVNSRICSEYLQLGSVGGRFSCRNPNLQQIPRDTMFRECFAATVGNKLVIADYSQIELRIAAEVSEDWQMIDAYAQGLDLHRHTASVISGKKASELTKAERNTAKAVNFGLVYGMGSKRLAAYAYDSYGVTMTENEAAEFHRKYFTEYRGLARWHQRIKIQSAWETRTLNKRRRLWADRPLVTQLANTPVQGTGADILKQALAWLPTLLKPLNAKILASVHDEIILECREDKALEVADCLKNTMERAGGEFLKKVPIVADVAVADSWADKA